MLKRNILVLSDSTNPWHSFWIRFGQYIPKLNANIHIAKSITCQAGRLNDPTTQPNALAADVLFLYRYCPENNDLENMIIAAKKQNTLIIADIDDYLWAIPSWNKQQLQLFNRNLRLCNYITCSTQALKEILRIMFPKQRIVQVPNSVPDRPKISTNLANIKAGPGDELTLIWTGAPWTRPNDLKILQPLAQWSNQKNNIGRFKWKHLGHADGKLSLAQALGIPESNVEKITLRGYREYLNELNGHIGLAPISRNTFNCFKSELKLLEYSHFGISWIASNIEPYQNLCAQWNWQGRLCNTSGDWIEHVKSLMDQKSREIEASKISELASTHNPWQKTLMLWQNLLDRKD